MNKDELIKIHLQSPYAVGETVRVRGLGIQNKKEFGSTCEISQIVDGGVVLVGDVKVTPIEDICKYTDNIGFDPMSENQHLDKIRSVNFPLDSIYYKFFKDGSDGVLTKKGNTFKPMNWNPFVMINGKKERYQRGFVWELEDKQSLIDSIYNRVACGSVTVRLRSYKWVDNQDDGEDCCFNDVVDGKQRMWTIHEFINDVFPDSKGRYYSSFSVHGKRKFMSNQLISYFEMGEDTTDEEVIEQFLRINFTGRPQSKEHIKYVKDLHTKL